MSQTTTNRWHHIFAALPPKLLRALLISQVIALLWWLAALWINQSGIIPIWYDQKTTFTQVGLHLIDPYLTRNFANPPWTALLLVPLSWLPLALAVLVQMSLYFAILTGLCFKFGGGLRSVVITLTAFVAFDSALELNVDWLVALGLLVPARWSGPLLLVKPQDALGYYLSVKWRDLLITALFVLVMVIASFLFWGWWPERLIHNLPANPSYNLAPLSLMPPLISVTIGLALAWIGFKRRDPVISVLAGLFFVPYIAFYSLLTPLALVSARWPRFAILVSIIIWIIYGGAIIGGLLLQS